MKENLFNKVFLWMFIGLMITFVTGYTVSNNVNLLISLCSSGMYFLLFIIELVIVVVLSRKVTTLDGTVAKILFCLYSFITGLTFASIFYLYELTSVMSSFLCASIVFGLFAFIGNTTNKDLSKLGNICIMTLIGTIIVSIINLFIGSSMLELGLSILVLILFMGITAWDIQKIKKLSTVIDNEDSLAIYGALELYLDFINIFIEILKIFGRKKD